MKVYIENTLWYGDDELLERYPDLDEFGYSVETVWTRDWYDREVVKKKPYITVESLEDLVKLRRAVQNPLIFDQDEDGNYIIEIYDGYRE